MSSVGMFKGLDELVAWPTSRKVAVIGVLVVVLTTVNTVIGHLLLAPLGWVDVRWWDALAIYSGVQIAGCTLVGWRVHRAGHEGRWTYYPWGIGYGLFLAGILYAFGPISSPMILLAVGVMLAVIVVFDASIGRFAMVFGMVTTLAVVVASGIDALPYAPALDGRSIDLHTDPRYVAFWAWVCLTGVGGNLLFLWPTLQSGRAATARLEDARRLIARYVPAEVAEDITSGALGGSDGHHRRKITVFFSDLVGFSDIAEELEPEDLALVLNEYFAEMTSIARRHHGTVDELQGDALLILFGAPRATTDREHAVNAVLMAAEMHAAMARLNARWRELGITEALRVRMGINTGVVTVGNFGGPDRLKYAALGKPVNVAARLQALARPGSTVVSEATQLLIRDVVECRALGPQELKGIARPVPAYEVG